MKLLLTFLFSFFFLMTYAQTVCSGGYGDPIFTETFGTSPDGTRTALSGNGSTTYTFDPGDGSSPITPSPQLDDEEYTLYSGDPFDLNNGWHQGEDHTTDVDGNMAVFNASFTPGVFYERDVSGLCPGTRMLFSAWIANILDIDNHNDIPVGNNCVENGDPEAFPNVKFEIFEQGTTNSLGFTETGNIPANGPGDLDWIEYSFELNLPAGVSDVTVQLSNSNPGGCGNDLAIDDIEFRACGPNANIIPQSVIICEGVSTTLEVAIDDGYATPFFQWQKYNPTTMIWDNVGPPGAGSTTYVVADPMNGDIYRYLAAGAFASLTDPDCRINSNPFTVSTVSLDAAVQAGSGGDICLGDPLTLIATIPPTSDPGDADGISGISPYVFEWFDPNGTSLGTGVTSGSSGEINTIIVPTAGFSDPDTWSVHVIDDVACEADDDVLVDFNCLPIELLSFHAKWLDQGNRAMIEWTTLSEIKNEKFMLQRRDDINNEFLDVAEIKAGDRGLSGNGYEYVDKVSGRSITYYYRLNQIDFDGTSTYSNIVSLGSNSNSNIYIVSDVVKSGFVMNIDLTHKQYVKQISVLNSLGNLVYVKPINETMFPGRQIQYLDEIEFAPGVYFFIVEFENEKHTAKGVK